MSKIFVGSRLRRLRREHKHTQAQMAQAIGVSTAYVNLIENNQRSLSVQVLMAISDAYAVDWRDLIRDDGDRLLADLRSACQDPLFATDSPDIQELRAAVDHAPVLVEHFLRLYRSHHHAIDRMTRHGDASTAVPETAESTLHDFFRRHDNYFDELEACADALIAEEPCEVDDVYPLLKRRLGERHGLRVRILPIEKMGGALRIHDEASMQVQLSSALDYPNRAFQLAHVLCLVELGDLLDALTEQANLPDTTGQLRCRVELANYFAAALLMPYRRFRQAAEQLAYDIDRLAAKFGVSFEQVCHRLTTLQRDGERGIPFFFLRVDKAGNVTKRLNASALSIAEYGGSCPVWDIHTVFSTPRSTLPQFVELPDGERFFTINRTSDRPAYSRGSQARRQAVSLGCELRHATRIGYAQPFNLDDPELFSPIGIKCQVCPRQACSQRAHQPLVVELRIDPSRRGDTRLES